MIGCFPDLPADASYVDVIGTSKGKGFQGVVKRHGFGGVYMENVACESADAIYELKGNAQLPVENVAIKDVKVGLLRKFVKKANNVNHLLEKDVTYKMEYFYIAF